VPSKRKTFLLSYSPQLNHLPDESPQRPYDRLPMASVVFFYAVLGGGSYLFGRFVLEVNPFQPFADRPERPLVDLAIGVGIGLTVVLISRFLDHHFAWSREMNRTLRRILGNIRPVDALMFAVLSGIGEEIMFRGVLLPWIGLAASSLLFGVIHGFTPGSPSQMAAAMRQFLPLIIAATVMGFAFGYTVEYTGNILAAVVAHFTINFLNLSEMYREDWEKQGTS
jgi:membrane protease YdiL (CAAX protease family)